MFEQIDRTTAPSVTGKDATDAVVEVSITDRVREGFEQSMKRKDIDLKKLGEIHREVREYKGEEEPKVLEIVMRGVQSVYEQGKGNRIVEGACKDLNSMVLYRIANRLNDDELLNEEDLCQMIKTVLIYKSSPMYEDIENRNQLVNHILWDIVEDERLYQNNSASAIRLVKENIGETEEIDRDMMRILNNTKPEEFVRFFRLVSGDTVLISDSDADFKIYVTDKYSQTTSNLLMERLPSLENFYIYNEKFATNLGFALLRKIKKQELLYEREKIFLKGYIKMFDVYMRTNTEVWKPVIRKFEKAGLLEYALNERALEEKSIEKKIHEL